MSLQTLLRRVAPRISVSSSLQLGHRPVTLSIQSCSLVHTCRHRPVSWAIRRLSSSNVAAGAPADKTLYRDQNDTWVDRHAPSAIAPYLKLVRIDRPIGTWLVLLPGWWGVAMCAVPGQLPDLSLMAIFGAGAFLMRGAGCTMNDLWDRRFDSQVARTRLRPLASGRISVPAALTFLAAQLSLGFGLLIQLPAAAIQMGFGAVALAGVYPSLKRVTHFPQAVLGLAMNYGVPMAWASTAGSAATAAAVVGTAGTAATATAGTAVAAGQGAGTASAAVASPSPAVDSLSLNSITAEARELVTQVLDPATLGSLLADPQAMGMLTTTGALYAGAACWTMVYDTLYAHQDKDDDAKLGLKSTALWMADKTVPILSGLAITAAGAWTAAGVTAGLAWPYYGAVGLSTGHMLWQVWTADLGDRMNLTRRFTSNTVVGWTMLAGIVAGKVMM